MSYKQTVFANFKIYHQCVRSTKEAIREPYYQKFGRSPKNENPKRASGCKGGFSCSMFRVTARVVLAMDRPPGNETKDESVTDLNTPGFEPETQCSEVECSTKRTALKEFDLKSMLHMQFLGLNI